MKNTTLLMTSKASNITVRTLILFEHLCILGLRVITNSEESEKIQFSLEGLIKYFFLELLYSKHNTQ